MMMMMMIVNLIGLINDLSLLDVYLHQVIEEGEAAADGESRGC